MFGLCCCSKTVCDFTADPPNTRYEVKVFGVGEFSTWPAVSPDGGLVSCYVSPSEISNGFGCTRLNFDYRYLNWMSEELPPEVVEEAIAKQKLPLDYLVTEEVVIPDGTIYTSILNISFRSWLQHVWYLNRSYRLGTNLYYDVASHFQFDHGQPIPFDSTLGNPEEETFEIYPAGECPNFVADVVLAFPEVGGEGYDIVRNDGVLLHHRKGGTEPTMSDDVVACTTIVSVISSPDPDVVPFELVEPRTIQTKVVVDRDGKYKATWGFTHRCCDITTQAVSVSIKKRMIEPETEPDA